MSEIEVPDCPLCMEAFEIDDINFFPCTCGYQVCRFCWHRIRTDENGLCPACRKTYSEDPAMYQPLSQDELQKIKKQRKQREVQQRQKASDNRQHLSNIRVIQKHLVFVVGLSNKMADPEVLRRQEYFGKYGKILKIVINPNTNYAGPQGPSASAYITYSKEEEALRTILSINNMQPPLKIRASLGTTKYCTHYLRNTICPKQDCMYLHDVGDMNASFTKEDMQAGKHQIFEKDLLDNYMLSVQKQRQGSCHNQPTSSNGNDISEDVSDSAWADVDLDNHLPSNASWAAIRDEKDKKMDTKSRTSSVTSTDYPTIDVSNKTSSNPPTSAIDIKGNRTQDESLSKLEKYSPKNSSSYPKGGWMQQTDTIKEKKEDQIEYITPVQSIPPSRPQQPVPPSVIPQPPISSAPLPTTTSMSVSSNITSNTTTTTSTTVNNYPWPSITDLGLSDLRILPSDDELGFDPFKESKTGLEDLIATEKKQGLSSTETTLKPTFSWDSFWPSNYGNTTPMMMGGTSYSLFGSVQTLPHQQMRPTAPVNPFMKPSANTNNNNIQQTTSPLQNSSPSFPFRFSNPQGSPRSTMGPVDSFLQQQPPPPPPQQQIPNGIPNHASPYHPSYGSRFPFIQPAMNPLQKQHPPSQNIPLSTATTTTTSTTITASSEASSDKNWQDGLRALLPNINISFACNNWNNENENWNKPETGVLQQPQQPQTAATVEPKPKDPNQVAVNSASLQSSKQPQLQQQNVSANPPPGFSLLVSFESKNKSSWPEKLSDEQRQPPPPPGFGSSNEGYNATTTSALATTTTSTASQPTPSAAKNIPQNTNSHSNNNKRHSQNLGSHEDPSILWSKVLSDKTSREIETTNMVFPLPGETVDQALSSSNLPATPPQNQQHQHMMSWNSVVSGNQYGKSPTASTTRDIMEPCSVNTASGKETKEQTRPQKPSPIFGNHQKHAVKKPTAHVKPLKCTPPTDGFMTVNSSTSISHRQQINGSAHTGSRVSELDDFSIDLPLAGASNINLTANVVRSFVEYPPVNQTSTVTSSKNKKKKKKGKEQGGLISEVIVGLSTSSVVERSSIEDEKPKKAKNKKKNTKSSPPSQRKIIDGNIEEKRSGDEHNIRVMKTDTSTHASVQVTTENSNSGQVHDQEIVSRLTESTEKLLKNVLFETEAIKLNTEQISKDLKSALEKCKESSLSLSDLEKINLLLTPAKLNNTEADDSDLVDTSDLERQVESARREAKLLEARLNDVIRKNMASELETLKRNTKSPQQ